MNDTIRECEFCGAPLSHGASFCDSCGQPAGVDVREGQPPEVPQQEIEPQAWQAFDASAIEEHPPKEEFSPVEMDREVEPSPKKRSWLVPAMIGVVLACLACVCVGAILMGMTIMSQS